MAPVPSAAKRPSESSLAFGLFRIVAIVLLTSGAAGALDAAPASASLLGSTTSASLTQGIQGFFTQLWSPGTSDAEKLGTAYIHDEAGNLLAETGTGGANSTGSIEYIYLPTANGSMPIAAVINGQIHAIHSDHLDTPRRLTDSQGQVVWQWAYSAFGEEKPTIARNRFANLDVNPNPGTTNSPAIEFNLRYPNHYADKESGLFHNRNRFYSPQQGRYTQGDAFGLTAGPNRFVYANGDPLDFYDPDGFQPRKGMPHRPTDLSLLEGGTGGGGAIGGGGGGMSPFGAVARVSPPCPPSALANANKTDRLKAHILNGELDAARWEAAGQVIARKADGTPWNHVQELRDAQRGLLNRIDSIKGQLSRDGISDAHRSALQREVGEASKLLDKTEGYLPR